MVILSAYFLVCFVVGAMSWALHWGAQAQVIVLVMGLSVFPLQKFLHKAPVRDLGFRRCTVGQLSLGLLLPILILGTVALADLVLGTAALQPLSILRNPFGGNQVASLGDLGTLLLLNAGILFLLEFVTEELMFRGYLLGKLLVLGEGRALLAASGVFGLWHLPIALWGVGFEPVRTTLYLLNMGLLGGVLCLLFLESRSLIPVAAFHGLWNSLEYNLFGFMDQRTVLAGASRVVFDPEEGCIGTLVLALVVLMLWSRRKQAVGAPLRKQARQTVVPAP